MRRHRGSPSWCRGSSCCARRPARTVLLRPTAGATRARARWPRRTPRRGSLWSVRGRDRSRGALPGLQRVVSVCGTGPGEGGAAADGVDDGLLDSFDALGGPTHLIPSGCGHEDGAVVVGHDDVPGLNGDTVDGHGPLNVGDPDTVLAGAHEPGC